MTRFVFTFFGVCLSLQTASALLLCISVAALSSFFVVASSHDPCVFENGMHMDVQYAWACINTIPFDPAMRNNTITSLLRAFPLYNWLDLAADPPAPSLSSGYSIPSVDLMKSFEKFGRKAYITAYDFHRDLAHLTHSLKDAHTRYIIPKCYRLFTMWQPFQLLTHVDAETGQQVIHISADFPPDRLQYFATLHGIDLRKYAGASVETINDTPALQWLTEFADQHIGLVKDLGTRFNLLFLQPLPLPNLKTRQFSLLSSLFSNRNSDFAPFPDQQEEYYSYGLTLTDGTSVTLTLPWTATFHSSNPQGVSSSDQFYNEYYLASPVNTTTAASADKPFFVEDNFQPDPSALFFSVPATSAAKALPSKTSQQDKAMLRVSAKLPSSASHLDLSAFKLLMACPDVHFYTLTAPAHSRVVVLVIGTFEPADTSLFRTTISDGLAAAAALGKDQLILDFSYNGGGDICLGLSLLNYLMPTVPVRSKFPGYFDPTDMPVSPLATRLAEIGAENPSLQAWWNPTIYQDNAGRNLTNSSKWMSSPQTRFRAGGKKLFSQMIHLAPSACVGFDVPANPVNVSKIIMLSRGLCGSTCALFSDHAALFDHVETVVIGGFPAQPMQFWSFPGLEVFQTPDILTTIQAYMVNDTANAHLVPPQLTTTAAYRYCGREAYGTDFSATALPLEYAFTPADHHWNQTLQYTLHPSFAWLDVADRLLD